MKDVLDEVTGNIRVVIISILMIVVISTLAVLNPLSEKIAEEFVSIIVWIVILILSIPSIALIVWIIKNIIGLFGESSPNYSLTY